MRHALLATSVGLVLALLFALVMGASIGAVLFADFMVPGRVMAEPQRLTLQVCAGAGFLAGLTAWGLQSYAATRGLVMRFVYALVIFVALFFTFAGLLEVATKFYANPAARDFSLSGLYFASVGGFYFLAAFVLIPPRLALFGLWLAAALILALVGPRQPLRRAKN